MRLLSTPSKPQPPQRTVNAQPVTAHFPGAVFPCWRGEREQHPPEKLDKRFTFLMHRLKLMLVG